MDTKNNPTFQPPAYLANVFSQKFVEAINSQATPATLSLSDGNMNPADRFYIAPAPSGVPQPTVTIVIINLLQQPLFGVACLEDNTSALGADWCIRTAPGTPKHPHLIPAMRLYPRPSKHGNGDPTNPDSWLTAIGGYTFSGSGGILGGIAFSLSDDGAGPLLGVAVQGFTLSSDIYVAAAADLSLFSTTSVQDDLSALAGACAGDRAVASSTLYEVGIVSTTPYDPNKDMYGFLVWVRPASGAATLVTSGGQAGDLSARGDPTDPFGS